MGRNALIGAGAGSALALFFYMTVNLFPVWGVPLFAISAGLVASGLFVWIFLRQPPSLERFRRLSACGVIAVSGLSLGTIAGVMNLPLGIDRIQQLFFLTAFVIVLMIGLFAFVVWNYLVARSYNQRSTTNTDFEDDSQGNPTRPRGPHRP